MKKAYYHVVTWIVGKTHYRVHRILPRKLDGWLYGQMILGKSRGHLD